MNLYEHYIEKIAELAKEAYGGAWDDFEYDRWLDGGLPWHTHFPKGFYKDNKKVAALTKAFADSAHKQGGKVFFSPDRGETLHTPEHAIKQLLKSKDIDTYDNDGLPYYYELHYPPGNTWPEGHPIDIAYRSVMHKPLKPIKMQKLAAVDQSYQATRLSQRRRRAAHLKSDIAFTKQPVMKHDFEQKQIASSAAHVKSPKMKKPKAKKFNPKKSIKKPKR